MKAGRRHHPVVVSWDALALESCPGHPHRLGARIPPRKDLPQDLNP